MKDLNDNQLVWRIKAKDCSDCLFVLSKRHSKLFYKMSQRYFPPNLFYGDQTAESFIGSKESIIYECARGFRSNKGVKFSTWLGNFVRYKCLNYLNKNSRYVSLEEEKLASLFNEKSIENFEKTKSSEDFHYVFNLLQQMKDARVIRVFNLRYLSGEKKMTWGEIGAKMNISSQTAINLHDRGRIILRKKITNMNNSDKIF